MRRPPELAPPVPSSLHALFSAAPVSAASLPVESRAALPNARAREIAEELLATLDTLFGPGTGLHDDALNLPALKTDLTAVLSAPQDASVTVARASALVAFARPLVARHALAPATWTLLLDRAACHPGLAGHPFATVVPQLTGALPRLPYLRAVAKHFESLAPSPTHALVEPALAFHAFLAAEPDTDLALGLAAALAPSLPATLLAELDPIEAGLVAHLRENLEQTEVDEAEAAFAWLRRLHTAPAVLAPFSPAQPSYLTALSEAALHAALAPAGLSVASLFRLRLVGRHGLHAAADAEALLPAASALASATPEGFSNARIAARSLTTLARDLAAWPDTLLADDAPPAVARLARVLVEEHRLRRPAAARAAAFRRLALGDDAAPPASGSPGLPTVSTLDTLAGREAWRAPEPAATLAALHAALPGLNAAVTLLHDHLALGADVARRVYLAQPAYAERTGRAGETALAKDNALTLRQLALLLLDGLPQPAERLQTWWSAVVGIHLVNRPPDLFVHNLRCLHTTLRSALPAEGLARVFAPLHQLYKETVGVPDSPLLHFGTYSVSGQPDLPSIPLIDAARKRHLRRINALAAATDPATFTSAWSTWLDASSWQKLITLVAAHRAEPVLRALVLLLGDLTREHGPDHTATRQAATLPGRLALHLLAAHLETPIPAQPPAAEGELALAHGFLAEQLRRHSLDHAVLQAARFVVEVLGPHQTDTAEAWLQNTDAIHARLTPACPAVSRVLLDRWTRQLQSIGPRLFALRPFLQLAYPAGHPALSRSADEETRLRGALTAALLPQLLPDSAPWPGAGLSGHVAITPDERERLVAFLDTLFDQLDGANYYELLEILSAPVPASVASPRPPAAFSAPLVAAISAPPAKKGLLGALFGPPPEHLAHDLALTALFVPDWLASQLPELVPEPLRPVVAEQLRAWRALA